MSSIITSITGTAGGAGGTGFQGPQAIPINNPVTQDQINQALIGSQTGLQGQDQLLQQLQNQQGLQNQSNVFNQLQGVANGTGPNPAQAQLAQATAANTANQAALMAGQRGTSANPGMLARQVAQNGAANQQNAALQAATLQSQQQLGALNQLGGQAAGMANNQIGQTNANTAANQAQFQNLVNPNLTAQGQSLQQQQGINSANAGMAGARLGQQGALLGGILNAAGPALKTLGSGGGAALGAEGGKVQHYNEGTLDAQPSAAAEVQSPFASKFGNYLSKVGQAFKDQDSQNQQQGSKQEDPLAKGAESFASGLGTAIGGMFKSSPPPVNNTLGLQTPESTSGHGSMAMPMEAKGGKVPALLSPGEKYIAPKDLPKIKAGANPMSVGKTVPGKPKVGGAKNSYANDNVEASLDEGGIVLPRSVTKSKNPQWEAHKFVSALMANGGLVPSRKKKAK